MVIPSFAVGRTQELLYLFRELIEEEKMHSLPIHVDSPMAIDVTHLYEKHREDHSLELDALEEQGIKPFSPPNLHFDKTVDESKQLNDAHYPDDHHLGKRHGDGRPRASSPGTLPAGPSQYHTVCRISGGGNARAGNSIRRQGRKDVRPRSARAGAH